MPRMVHNSAVELTLPLFRRKRRRSNINFCLSAGLQPFSIVGRRYSAGSSHRFSPFFSDRFERRGLVYVGADYSNLLIHDESYQYDLNGNRELVTNAYGDLVVYTTGTNNELNSDGNYSYTYDAEGNRISKTNAAGTERELYVWDYRNRLSSVTKQEFNTTTQEWEDVQIVEYAYDYNNVLIRKVLDVNGDGVSDSKTLFLPENYQTAVQLDDADLSDSTDETVSHRYLWTPQNQDKLLADIQVSPTGSETLWTLTDHLGTIRDIIQQTPTGLIQKTHVIYDAYGNVLSCKDANGTDIESPVLFGFTGKYFDADTQLQNNVNRWYDAATGRWLSTDPIGFNGNDTNLYRYVGNSVIQFFDNLGLDWLDCLSNCIQDNDPADYAIGKAISLLTATPIPKTMIAAIAETLGFSDYARQIRLTLKMPGVSRFTNFPSFLSQVLRMNAKNGLRTLGAHATSIVGPVIVGYGLALAYVESYCFTYCTARSCYGIGAVYDPSDNIIDSVINMYFR